MIRTLKSLGPGLLFAGAAIGVSHLVQSTRAGADFGFGLLWALLLINIIKYPFFQFGPRYAQATGESLLEGYHKLSKPILIAYFIITFATMFTIQTAVTIVTAGLAATLFGFSFDITTWCVIITLICLAIVTLGRYKLLDNLMKVIIIVLTISTLFAVFFASNEHQGTINWQQIIPANATEIGFLIAFMGWMPAPLDISIWHSLWEIEKNKTEKRSKGTIKLFDFNIGYITTLILGGAFVALGALVMYDSGTSFSPKATVFAQQLIDLYTSSLGKEFSIIIAIAAFTTMFSTTLTTLDASPRAMARTAELMLNKPLKHGYLVWISVLIIGTLLILTTLISSMGLLIKIATILSFITAPFYAILNYRLLTSKHTPEAARPNTPTKVLSIIGILSLFAFSVWYITTL